MNKRSRRLPATVPATPAVSCGCPRCTCVSAPACRCHVYNALIALALWDLRHAPRARQP